MTRKLIHPALIGKMIQKVEKDEKTNMLYVHTKGFILAVSLSEELSRSHTLTPREGKPEPLVIPANK